MSYARVTCRKVLLLIGLASATLFAAAGTAHAASFGEITRFGGPGPSPGELTKALWNEHEDGFSFQPQHVIGVDPEHNEVFVLEEYEPSSGNATATRYLRLQELSSEKGSEGKLLGDVELKVKTPSGGGGDEEETEEIQGVAIDPTAKRLYFLVTQEREENITDESESAAAAIYGFKTTPNSKKELEPVSGATSEGEIVGQGKLKPESPTPGVSLLQPHGITVDPATDEVIIAAHIDTEQKCEEKEEEEEEILCEDELLQHHGGASDHYVTQRVKENAGTWELGERYVDTGNVLKQAPQEDISFFAPGSPVVVGSGAEERLLASDLVQLEPGVFEPTIDEFPASAAGTAKQFVLPDASPSGAEGGFTEIEEEPIGDYGGSLAVSPDGKTLYGFTRILNEEVEGHHEHVYGISERSAETLAPIGWTGGQRADTTDECVLEPGIYEGQHVQIAAGKDGDVFVLVPEYLHNPPKGATEFPTHDAIIEFGEGGKGCPAAATEKNDVLVGGKPTTEPVGTTTPVTLSTFVKQGDALSVVWTLENDTTKAAPVRVEQSADQYQQPKLEHTFAEPGKYKVTEAIKTDNLDTPTLNVSMSLEAVSKTEAPHITTQPHSDTVKAGETASFTAGAAGVPTPSPAWWVSKDGGKEFEKDTADKGGNTDTLQVSATEPMNGYEYYAVFTNSLKESAKTETVKLTVTAGESKAKETPTTTTPTTTVPTTTVPTTTVPTTTVPGGGVLPSKVVSPSATIATAAASVSSSGAVSLKVTCPAGATTCIGTVTLRTASAISAAAGKKKAVVTLATGSFSISGGQSKTITLHLTATARKLLTKLHELHGRAMVSAHDPAGEDATTAKLVTLRPAAVKHKH